MLFLSPRVTGILTVFSFLLIHFRPTNAAGLARQILEPLSVSPTTSDTTSTSSTTPTSSPSSTPATPAISPATPSSSSTTSSSSLGTTSSSTASSSSPSSTSSSSSSSSTVSSSSSSSTVSLSRSTSSSIIVPTVHSTSSHLLTSTHDGSTTSSTSSATGGSNTVTGNSQGFFENKSAVGGTFAAVGLVGVALIGGIIYFLIKRRRRIRDDDEVDAYFDKSVSAGARYPRGGRSSPDSTFPLDHSVHRAHDAGYGANVVNYNDPYSYGMDYPPDTSSFTGTRPTSAAPGTAYAAAISQQGPYQYYAQPTHGHSGDPTATGDNIQPLPDRASQASPQDHDEAYAYDPFYVHQ